MNLCVFAGYQSLCLYINNICNQSGLLFTYGHLLGLRTASICVALGSMFADPNANVYGAYADPEHLARRIETATRIAMRAAEQLEGTK